MARKKPLPICGVQAHPRFRGPNVFITACVQEPGHEGEHVFCVKVPQGIDDNSHALHYMGEERRTSLRPILFVDMKGKEFETDEECAALWQFFEYLKKSRK